MSAPSIDRSLRERILKVLRLAQQGVGGEKENAEALLNKLLHKHGLSRDALEIDQLERDHVWHPYTTAMEKELLICIATCACQRKLKFTRPETRGRVLGVEATPSEHIAITVLCDVYFPKFASAAEELLIAFVFRHRLFDETEPDDEYLDGDATMDEAKIDRLRALMEGLENVERPRRRLGAQSGAQPTQRSAP